MRLSTCVLVCVVLGACQPLSKSKVDALHAVAQTQCFEVTQPRLALEVSANKGAMLSIHSATANPGAHCENCVKLDEAHFQPALMPFWSETRAMMSAYVLHQSSLLKPEQLTDEELLQIGAASLTDGFALYGLTGGPAHLGCTIAQQQYPPATHGEQWRQHVGELGAAAVFKAAFKRAYELGQGLVWFDTIFSEGAMALLIGAKTAACCTKFDAHGSPIPASCLSMDEAARELVRFFRQFDTEIDAWWSEASQNAAASVVAPAKPQYGVSENLATWKWGELYAINGYSGYGVGSYRPTACSFCDAPTPADARDMLQAVIKQVERQNFRHRIAFIGHETSGNPLFGGVGSSVGFGTQNNKPATGPYPTSGKAFQQREIEIAMLIKSAGFRLMKYMTPFVAGPFDGHGLCNFWKDPGCSFDENKEYLDLSLQYVQQFRKLYSAALGCGHRDPDVVIVGTFGQKSPTVALPERYQADNPLHGPENPYTNFDSYRQTFAAYLD